MKNQIIAGVAILAVTLTLRFTDALPKGHRNVSQDKRVPDQYVQTAVFAGGCFWCMEPPFEKLTGVIDAESGYTGGTDEDPTYPEVCAGGTGHLEAIRVSYDTRKLSYSDLLKVFWRTMDPTDAGGQFGDRGESYTSAIFVANDMERELAESSKKALDESGRFDKPVVTPIRDADVFYPAELYHQDFYLKNPIRYRTYRYASGRDHFLRSAWGKDLEYKPEPGNATKTRTNIIQTSMRTYTRPADDELRERLTPLQYNVTQNAGTEKAFSNEYWDNKDDGIYVDIVSGEPLFSSRDKFRSGTGWPSFTQPLIQENVLEKTDYKMIFPRTEVRSKHGDSHLGHVFTDGPQPTGLRYCINSAALRFVSADQLDAAGYKEFATLFTEPSGNSK